MATLFDNSERSYLPNTTVVIWPFNMQWPWQSIEVTQNPIYWSQNCVQPLRKISQSCDC